MQCNIRAVTLLLTALAVTACTHGDEPRTAGLPVSAGAPSTAGAASLKLAPGLDIGMWVWHREEVTDPAERSRLLTFCQTYGITRLFVQVRFEGEGEALHLASPADWQSLLQGAAKAGVIVEALDGSSQMGFAANRPETLRRLAAVLDFQRAQPASARFGGLHYDIEPYTSARWKDGDVQAVMLELLETMVAINTAARAADPRLTVSHDIPAFYDGQDKYLIEFNGVRKNFHEHIQDVSDYVGIMSYRTRATGPNSVTAISAVELDYAAKIGRPAYLSLETVPLKETPQITFHGRSPEDYRATIRELGETLGGKPGFGGILLHQYRTIRTLLEGPENVTGKE